MLRMSLRMEAASVGRTPPQQLLSTHVILSERDHRPLHLRDREQMGRRDDSDSDSEAEERRRRKKEKKERREADPPSARRARAGSTKKPKKQD